MSDSRYSTLRSRLAGLCFAAQAVWTAALLFGLWLAAAPVAYFLSSEMGIAASAVACGVCMLGAALALAISAAFPGPSGVMQRMLLAMLARTMVPLVAGVAVSLRSPALSEAGLIYYLLIFYLATLVIETTMLVAQVSSPHAANEQS